MGQLEFVVVYARIRPPHRIWSSERLIIPVIPRRSESTVLQEQFAAARLAVKNRYPPKEGKWTLERMRKEG